ncbi:MAG: pantoate--beta-alanine ligase [bacterium]|nr:pantoate--beta-alanine ligase [bacterium]
MEIISSIAETRNRLNRVRHENKRIGFVPTMGFLHEGHLSLVDISKQHADYHVMSIFVNKIQFNNPGDFSSYPKDLERDFKLAEEAGVDLIFLPDDEEMYKNGLTRVDVDVLTENLCGAHRPGHFSGVFTVVSKLFNIIQPDISVFGQKDIQQIVSIEKMVLDLNFPVRIIMGSIKREEDGLAMSSRNKHLNPDERKNALVLSRSLKRAEEMLQAGERDSANIGREMEAILQEGKPDSIDYISFVNYDDLSLVDTIPHTAGEKAVIAVAVFFGETRLIDNMVIENNNGETRCLY